MPTHSLHFFTCTHPTRKPNLAEASGVLSVGCWDDKKQAKQSQHLCMHLFMYFTHLHVHPRLQSINQPTTTKAINTNLLILSIAHRDFTHPMNEPFPPKREIRLF